MLRIFVRVLGFSILLLSACTATYPPPAPLRLSEALYQSTDDSQMAIAMDSGGGKHIVRVECKIDTGSSCRVIYEVTHTGEQGIYKVYTPASDYTFRNPDVAVTDSGLAIVIWQNCPASDSATRLCSTWFVRSNDLNSLAVLDLGTHSLSAPIIASRGEIIYAVHEVTIGAAGSALRYCKVSDAPYTCYWVSNHPAPDDGVRRMNAAAAVSGSGSLHIAWLEGVGSSKTAYSNDNYGAINADMAKMKNLGYAPFFPPAVAIETDDTYYYIAMATNENTSDHLTMYYCIPSNCNIGGIREVDLQVAKQWYLFSSPSITAGPNWALVGFSAVNTDHPTQSDIYWYTYKAGEATPSVSRPYPTTLQDYSHDCDPVVALIEGWMSVGWHICGFPPSRDDIYLYDSVNGGRIIHAANNFAGRGGFDMAANGDLVAGIWNETGTEGHISTWLAFNSHMVWLPMVIR
ncbi:MAG: hypothetical protein CVU39_15140 [Chloroflexi bacterium HGW-Chloroflexi-10]|nr:MAG: hypothetical protein CVU39_15140 [Chloroflexi bacterium HGW-Chloroflexi-10]